MVPMTADSSVKPLSPPDRAGIAAMASEKIVPFEEASADAREMVAYQKKRAGQGEYLQGLLTEAGIQVLAPEFFEAPAPAPTGDEGEGTTEEGASPEGGEEEPSGE